MDQFQKCLQLELAFQQKNLKEQEAILKASPDGSLVRRSRKNQDSYYLHTHTSTPAGRKSVQTNITKDPSMIHALTRKAVAAEVIKAYEINIPALLQLQASYVSVDPQDISTRLSQKYEAPLRELQQHDMEQWLCSPYKKCPYFPHKLNHLTAYGEYVRSKSEVIIANALYTYGIPFHYEERLLFTQPGEPAFYPDFTIFLPDHSRIYWEHLGMLHDEDYRANTAEKICEYHLHNLIIGQNLILTQDDAHGSCNSAYIYDVIELQLLPRFHNLSVDKRLFHQKHCLR